MDPRFSVIIPTYNRAKLVCKAIESVGVQTYPAWEIIVVDDGSSDETVDILAFYPQVRYHYQDNAGVSAARNKGASLASGDWLIFLDSDDELFPNAIQEFTTFLCSNPDSKLIKARLILNSSNSVKTKSSSDSGFIPGSYCIDKMVFESLGGFDVNLKFAENTELIFRLNRSKALVSKLDKVVLLYNQNTAGGSKNLQNMLDSTRLILEKHDDYLSNHVKHLYHQNIGVIEMRFGRYRLARRHLWKSWKFKPKRISTLLRLILAFLPSVARKIYTPEIGLK